MRKIIAVFLLFICLVGCSGSDNETPGVHPAPAEPDNDQQTVYQRHILENEYLKVEVSELGATLVRFIDKKTSQDIVLGYNSDEDYLRNEFNIGASIEP